MPQLLMSALAAHHVPWAVDQLGTGHKCRYCPPHRSLAPAQLTRPPLPRPHHRRICCTQALSSGDDVDRRSALIAVGGAAIAASLSPLPSASSTPEPTSSRSALLAAIAAGNDTEVKRCIEDLVLQDPTGGAGATSPALEGQWRLVWSARAEAFSPLLKLPSPLRPGSFQLLGKDAATEVGEGRVAQLLTGGVLGSSQLWLSSAVAPAQDSAAILEIFPPFRLELASRAGADKRVLVEAGSDAEFRSVNLRTMEEQAAPKNRYLQRYLETTGNAGDLRISTIESGDPVIVGAVFVHQRI